MKAGFYRNILKQTFVFEAFDLYFSENKEAAWQVNIFKNNVIPNLIRDPIFNPLRY